MVIAYAGTSFLGWQKTSMGPSVEETLENALFQILQHPVSLQAASRTDAGVHAQGQVVNAILEKPWDLSKLKYRLNTLLPKTISILSMEDVPIDFHPTLHTRRKHYLYQICTAAMQLPFSRETSWHFPYSLDLEAMCHAAKILLGTHDFSSFCNERALWDRDPVCTLESILIEPFESDRIRIEITGDHFLYKMMRNLVGTLVYVGCGKIKEEEICDILTSKDRIRAGMTAPAHGLFLKNVIY
jgi:tRNA pseudouridine38-40 synthase